MNFSPILTAKQTELLAEMKAAYVAYFRTPESYTDSVWVALGPVLDDHPEMTTAETKAVMSVMCKWLRQRGERLQAKADALDAELARPDQ